MSIFKSEKIEKSLGVVLDVLFALVLLFSLFMTVSTLAQLSLIHISEPTRPY